MADISRTVDEVRGFLLSFDQIMKPGLAELAQTYVDCCVEANRRLARCQRLLQQGLRAEAIHLSKEPPDLLDSIQSLDFAERAAWLELVRQYDLAIPPEFDATAIEFLHAAHVEENPLRELLKSHRRLALQRAPLAQRLQVLRQLATNDPNSPIWPADIQIFEAARIDQITREAAEAKRLKDLATLGLLKDELTSETWSSPPPKPLTRDVTQTLSHLRSLRKRQDQVGLIAELHDAFAALDVDQGRAIRTRWLLMDGDGDPRENPLYSQVEPVFLWLAERDREDVEENYYHQALADLTQSVEIEANSSRAELEDSHEALVRSGRGVPEDLDRKYRERIAHHERQTARKRQLLVAGVIALVAACLGAAALIQSQRGQEDAARKTREQVDGSVSAGRLLEAREFLDKQLLDSPWMADHPAVVDASKRLAEKEAAEKERFQAFDDFYRQAEAAADAAIEPEALASAREHAETPEEKIRVEKLASLRQRRYHEALARIDEEAGPKLKGLYETISESEHELPISGTSEKAVRVSLQKTKAGLRNLDDQVKRPSGANRRLLDQIDTCLNRVQKALGEWDTEREVVEEISGATKMLRSDPEKFAKALEDSIAKLPPGSDRSRDFQRVLEEKKVWEGALKWARFAWKPRLAPNDSESPDQAAEKVAECEKLLNDYPEIPDRALIEDVHKHYQAVALRTIGKENLRGSIEELLSMHVIANVHITKIIDMRETLTYYSKEPMLKKGGMLRAIIDYEKNMRIISINQEIIPTDGTEAPQSKLAGGLMDSLRRHGDLIHWDAMMLDFIQDVGQEATTNPILKFVLISHLAKIAAKGSRPLEIGLGRLQKEIIPNAKINDNLHWMDPKDQAAKAAEPNARKFVQNVLDHLPEVKKKTQAAYQSLADRCSQIPQPGGFLIEEDKVWVPQTSPELAPPQAGEACIVKGSSPAEWQVVGSHRGSQFDLTHQQLGFQGNFFQGTVVFTRPKPEAGADLGRR